MNSVKGNRAAFLLMMLLGGFVSQAQYSNDWINPAQSYFKIPISKEGVYKLTYSDLLNAGFPVNAVDPRFLQLFHRGQEQAIYVKGESDAVFNASDYIEFYGKKNDGTLDKILYKIQSNQPHNYHNLYSDTTAYFLTFALTPPRGLRMDSVQLVNVNNLPAESYQYSTRLLVPSNYYSQGYLASDFTAATYFDLGEGWTGTFVRQGQTIDYSIDSVYNGVQTAGNPQIEIQLMGWDYPSHAIDILVGPTYRTLASVNFAGFQTYTINASLNWSDVQADGTIPVRLFAQAATTNRPQASINYIKITFPQSFDLSGVKSKKMNLEVKPSGQSFITLSNAPGMQLWDVTDESNIVRVLGSVAGSLMSAVIPGTSVSKTLVAFANETTPKIFPVSFRNIDPTSPDYIIITHRSLMKPALTYSDVVKSYAGYRASAAGGSFDTLVVTMDQLYNQFNYGETSPSAIYRFMKWMVEQGSPKYLLLIGKGKDIMLFAPYARLPLQPNEKYDLVPSAGFPGGDNAFTAGLNGTTYEPAVPTGRLPVSSPSQVAAYLNKVIEHESKPIQPWAKDLLHLSGGLYDATELKLFRSYVDGFKKIAEGIYLGGHVTTKSKSDVGLELINVEENVNKGVNLVTFFGHSSSSALDIDIGFATDPALGYNNAGKYPAFLINGCNTGTIFTDQKTLGEDWLLASGKGARNFIASTSFSYEQTTRDYTTQFYETGFADSVFIKKGIGDIQKESCRKFLASHFDDIFNTSIVQQMTLTGDPALKLFGTALPDYATDNRSISVASTDGKPVTSISPSFLLKIIVKNLGTVNLKPIRLRVTRTFNDNSTKTYDSTYSPVYYSDTLLFKVKSEKSINGFGNNSFTVVIDPLNEIKELSKSNNSATLNYFIPSNGTLNLYPPQFGIVATNNVNFLFQDTNLLGNGRNFQLEIDTTKTFNSQFVIRQEVSAKVLVKKNVMLPSMDSTVYFWRTKPVKQSASDSADWSVSSFIYINNSPEGWAQTKFDQITSDATVGLNPNPITKTFDYLQSQSTINVKSIGVNSASSYTDASIKVDGIEYNLSIQGLECRMNTINLMAFNKSSLVPYPGINFSYFDLRSCGRQPKVINSFTFAEMETGHGDDLFQCIDNITQSDSVVLFTIGDPKFSSWSSNLLTKLGDLGISSVQIAPIQNGEPVIIFARKGAPAGTASVFRSAVSPVVNQDLSVTKNITGRYTSGKIRSVIIGPAKQWIKFVPRVSDLQGSDVYGFTIYGVDINGSESLIASDVTEETDISFIDPDKFPQLRIELKMRDEVNLSAINLRKWFVFFESVADGLLYYDGSTDQQTVEEGRPFVANYGFVNISNKQFIDSLQVNSSVLTAGKGFDDKQFKISAPLPGDTTKFSVNINTLGKAGLNDISVYVNPKIEPEQFYENNIIDLVQYLNVLVDRSAPVLDVTIDGRYLQNGDFVSPDPKIKVKLYDENEFFLVKDTTAVTVLLSYPCATSPCPFTRIGFTRSDVTWTPASTTSDFEFNFSPVGLPEGTYVLQVMGMDASGNRSGASPYEISLQVKNETTLALRSVYPNPSTGTFNFSFALSGNVLPDEFSLQIFSSEGKLIGDFSKQDVTRFIVGTNILPWQSPTESGLLIYRLNISANGKSVSQSGKLILVR